MHLFDVEHSGSCSGPPLPADEYAWRSALYVADCVKQFAMPGNALTPSALEACVAATGKAPCQLPDGPPPECDFRGTLPGGAPCFHDSQCQSGMCPTRDISPGGVGPLRCGTCRAVFQLGEPCSGPCVVGSICVTDPATGSSRCVPLVYGEENAPCDELSKKCGTGLYCDGATRHCVPLRNPGEACGSQWPTGRKAPLHCTDAPGTCESPRKAGDSCSDSAQCDWGLACDLGTKQCAEVVWGDPGDLCDDEVLRCRSSTCPISPLSHGSPAACPVVVPEGSRCDEVHLVCDEGAVCFGEVCRSAHSVTCQ